MKCGTQTRTSGTTSELRPGAKFRILYSWHRANFLIQGLRCDGAANEAVRHVRERLARSRYGTGGRPMSGEVRPRRVQRDARRGCELCSELILVHEHVDRVGRQEWLTIKASGLIEACVISSISFHRSISCRYTAY